MAITAAEIERLIQSGLPDATVTITDLAGDGEHYKARVVSPSFQGRSKVAQHQMVYAALGEVMGGALHALMLETLPPS
ncbi:MAG: BolA family transcriptional regulator [Alphaproteobacteria bacterium]|nr:BolA family transcriptional regulator [Alphaproteobacteria bacterium]